MLNSSGAYFMMNSSDVGLMICSDGKDKSIYSSGNEK